MSSLTQTGLAMVGLADPTSTALSCQKGQDNAYALGKSWYIF